MRFSNSVFFHKLGERENKRMKERENIYCLIQALTGTYCLIQAAAAAAVEHVFLNRARKMDNEGSEENCTVLRVWHLRRNIASPFPPRDKGKEVKHILFFTK